LTCGAAWTSSCTGWRRRCQAGRNCRREHTRRLVLHPSW
jgi:hypothetical protein